MTDNIAILHKTSRKKIYGMCLTLQNYKAEDVLGLSTQQIITVVCYMLSEARGTSPLEDAVRLIGRRMDVLRACCRGNHGLVSAVVDFLVEQIAEKR